MHKLLSFPTEDSTLAGCGAESPRLCCVFQNTMLPVWCWQGLYFTWKGPMETLDKAGKAFLGLEALLGGSGFQVEGNIWRRQVCETNVSQDCC